MGRHLTALLTVLTIALLGTWANLAQPEPEPEPGLVAALPLPTAVPSPAPEATMIATVAPEPSATASTVPTVAVATATPTTVVDFTATATPDLSAETPSTAAGGLVGDVTAGKMGATQCIGCHSVDGSTMVGPSWKGIYGESVQLESGETVVIDDAYLTRAIVDPLAEIVKGYPPAMPPYSWLTAQQIADIIAYIKSLE
jgi:cytochrome c2